MHSSRRLHEQKLCAVTSCLIALQSNQGVSQELVLGVDPKTLLQNVTRHRLTCGNATHD